MTITDITTTRAEQIATEKPGVTVYSKPSCVQCDATKRALGAAGVEHTVVDMSVDATALDHVRALGHMRAPVVEVHPADGEPITWSGFRPDLIQQHIIEVA